MVSSPDDFIMLAMKGSCGFRHPYSPLSLPT